MAEDKVCLITGVGPGTGAAMARRFGLGGYKVAMLARDKSRLDQLEGEVEGARGYVCDVTDPARVHETVAQVSEQLGVPDVVIHNAVGGSFSSFMDLPVEELERNWQINVLGLFHLAKAVLPAMEARGSGALMVTGNTSALRGKPKFAGFAPTKAAQRILAQSLARDYGPKGIHVAYFIIDAVIDVAWTREMFPAPDEFYIKPDDIAGQVWNVAHQPRSAWSFDFEMRPFGETW